MAVEAEFLITALIIPIYPVLFFIYQKIGKYDQVCKDVRDLEDEIRQLWERTKEAS